MRTNVQKPGRTRPSSARGMRLGLMAVAMGVAGSALASTLPKEAPRASTSAKHSRFHVQIGRASWYGARFNGRKTASGERFNMNALTCAHRSLPLGTWVRVTNMFNQKSVFLRVNDRGPVPVSRVMDLSYAAAQRLGIFGLGKVRIEPMRSDDPQVAEAMLPDTQSMPLMQLASMPDGTPVLPTLVADR